MTATPRDLQKPRPQRVAEVYNSLQLQSGQANSQLVSFGCVVGVDATTTKFAVTAGEYVLGQSVVALAAQTAQNVPAGAALAAGQAVLVLIEGTPGGTLSTTVGAIVSGGAAAVLPAPTPANIVLGWLSLTGAFVVGTTVLTAPNCVTAQYSAGNVSPVGGF